jgi:hypothetical protein
MLVRGIGIRDISAVLQISITRVLKVLKSGKHRIKSKQRHYDCREIDGVWTHVGNTLWPYSNGCLGQFSCGMWRGGHLAGKEYTGGIEGNNCRLRHRIRRVFRRTCCLSRKMYNHLKAFDTAFFYINDGFV